MLSQKTRYAIRAMQHLADRYGEGPVQLSEIAEAQKIPANFLTVILSELSRVGLVSSLRGKDGGYWLALSPIDITYGDLIRVMRGSLALVPCASRFAHEKCSSCVEEGECRTRALMLKVRDETRPTRLSSERITVRKLAGIFCTSAISDNCTGPSPWRSARCCIARIA